MKPFGIAVLCSAGQPWLGCGFGVALGVCCSLPTLQHLPALVGSKHPALPWVCAFLPALGVLPLGCSVPGQRAGTAQASGHLAGGAEGALREDHCRDGQRAAQVEGAQG